MPNRKTFAEQERHDHSGHGTAKPERGELQTKGQDQPIPDDATVCAPGGFKNDPDDPHDPDEAIEKFRRKNLKP